MIVKRCFPVCIILLKKPDTAFAALLKNLTSSKAILFANFLYWLPGDNYRSFLRKSAFQVRISRYRQTTLGFVIHGVQIIMT